jgi:hypothetical protein
MQDIPVIEGQHSTGDWVGYEEEQGPRSGFLLKEAFMFKKSVHLRV